MPHTVPNSPTKGDVEPTVATHVTKRDLLGRIRRTVGQQAMQQEDVDEAQRRRTDAGRHERVQVQQPDLMAGAFRGLGYDTAADGHHRHGQGIPVCTDQEYLHNKELSVHDQHN